MSELIRIEVDDKEVRRLLGKVAGRTGNLRPVMREISGIMMDAVEENFEQEGRPAWPGLAPATREQRAKKGHWPGKILQRRGELAASITQKYDGNSAAVGSNKRYAAIHQLGGQAGRGRKVTIPPRPFLKMTDGDMQKVVRALMRYLGGE